MGLTSRAEAVQRLKEDYTALLATPTTRGMPPPPPRRVSSLECLGGGDRRMPLPG